MIEFNEKDFNMVNIKKELKMSDILTRNSYRIHGLKNNNDNPVIQLLYSYDAANEDLPDRIDELGNFFNTNGLSYGADYGDVLEKIVIGLRKDLRANPTLTCAILKTIIYSIEGRLDLKVEYKVKGMPKFKN